MIDGLVGQIKEKIGDYGFRICFSFCYNFKMLVIYENVTETSLQKTVWVLNVLNQHTETEMWSFKSKILAKGEDELCQWR